jgi:hypothetical protein
MVGQSILGKTVHACTHPAGDIAIAAVAVAAVTAADDDAAVTTDSGGGDCGRLKLAATTAAGGSLLSSVTRRESRSKSNRLANASHTLTIATGDDKPANKESTRQKACRERKVGP